AVGPSGQVTGLDLAPGMVTRTAAAAAEHPQVTVRIGDAQQPDVPAASVDVLTAGLVLFFLPDPAAALTAYRTILRPGGRLGVTAFAAFDPQYQQIMKIVARYAVDPRRPPALAPMFATGDSLAAAATEAGYTTPAVTEFAVQSRLRDIDQLLAWIGSHNGQATLGKVPEARRPKLRDALAAEFTGPLTLTTRIRVLVAVRPA
ncbi:MAG: class I SAM-dependent methyltransferase, partial [Actinoplanes sp.]